jgi:Zn-dependent M16 (insulinase) family peptidase
MLPSLTVNDIPRGIEFVDRTTKYIGDKVKVHFYEQPTNGITYVRIKANLKNLPVEHRVFVPMFKELFSHIGTKNYRYDKFHDKLYNCTSGVEVSVDKHAFTEDHTDVFDKKEQVLLQTGFLDRNVDDAFECLSELLATPNFDEIENISDLIRMEAVDKAQNMGNKGLEYGRSYSNSGLKAFAKSFEELNSDIFFCQFAQEILSTSNPTPLLKDAVIHMTEIASFLFREDNLEFAVHGNSSKFELITLKLELLLHSLKNNNSRFLEAHSDILRIDSEFKEQKYHQHFFKTPLAVNNCVESMLGPTYADYQNYSVGLVASELLTFNSLLPAVREKGGAYGAGCKMNESGLINFYSFRDPKLAQTYDNFERAVQDTIDGKFGDQQMQESKLLAF